MLFLEFEVIYGLKEIVLKIANPKKRFTITEHLNNFIMDAMMLFSEPASEVYSKAIKINEGLSPQNRKKNRSQNIRVVIKNQSLSKILNEIKTKSKTPITIPSTARKSEKSSAQNYELPQQRPIRSRSSFDLQISSRLKMSDPLNCIKKIQDESIRQYKSVQLNQLKKQFQQIQQQIQLKHQQRARSKQLKTRKQHSQKEFLSNCNKDKIEMMRKHRRYQSKSEIQVIRDLYQQTQRNHKWIQLKTLSTKIQHSLDLTYKTFALKNKQIPKKVYQNLASMLAINPIQINLPIKSSIIKTKASEPKLSHIKRVNKKVQDNYIEIKENSTETNDQRQPNKESWIESKSSLPQNLESQSQQLCFPKNESLQNELQSNCL